jgi:hypothetical protein
LIRGPLLSTTIIIQTSTNQHQSPCAALSIDATSSFAVTYILFVAFASMEPDIMKMHRERNGKMGRFSPQRNYLDLFTFRRTHVIGILHQLPSCIITRLHSTQIDSFSLHIVSVAYNVRRTEHLSDSLRS